MHIQPCAVPSRILTDLRVTQIDWWSERNTVLLPEPGLGLVAHLRTVISLIRSARGHDVAIVSTTRNALYLGLAKSLGLLPRTCIMTVETRLDDQRPTLRWRGKVMLQRLAFRNIDAVCVSARAEIRAYAERLRLSEDRFRFVPWHTNVLAPELKPRPNGYVFSAGRTGRDWKTLSLAIQGASYPVVIVCDSDGVARAGFPKEATVEVDVSYERYRELLLGSRLVVIPLEDHVYSSGQVVILEAMALGKPVVTTRTVGAVDYVVDEVNGLLVPPHDPAQLRRAIERLVRDPELASRLSRNGLETVLQRHTLSRYLGTVICIAEEIARPSCRCATDLR